MITKVAPPPVALRGPMGATDAGVCHPTKPPEGRPPSGDWWAEVEHTPASSSHVRHILRKGSDWDGCCGDRRSPGDPILSRDEVDELDICIVCLELWERS